MKKRVISILLMLCLVTGCVPAFALDFSRFVNEPDNDVTSEDNLYYGMSALIGAAYTGNYKGLMQMIYSVTELSSRKYPVIALMLVAGNYFADSATVTTDYGTYAITSFGVQSEPSGNGYEFTLLKVNADVAQMLRDIANSGSYTFTMRGSGMSYDFRFSAAQKRELRLIADEFDENIAPYMDPADSRYSAEFAGWMERTSPVISRDDTAAVPVESSAAAEQAAVSWEDAPDNSVFAVFRDEPGNQVNDDSAVYGLVDYAARLQSSGSAAGGMMMVASYIKAMGEQIPTILTCFAADSFIPTGARVITDENVYVVLSFGKTDEKLSTVDGYGNMIVTADAARMFRDIAASGDVQCTMLGDGKEYEFAFSAEQKHQLELIADAFDTGIAPLLDPQSADYNVLAAEWLGEISPMIISAKNDGIVEKKQETAAKSTVNNEKEYPELTTGSKGDDVKKLQKYLIALGYLSGKADGSFGNKTAEGVRAFQKAEKLEVTGIADSHTQNVLYAKKLPEKPPIAVLPQKLRTNSAGTPELYIRFRNDTDVTIDRLDFYVYCYDSYGDQMKGYDYYDYDDDFYEGKIKPGEQSPSNWYWGLYGYEGCVKVRIAVHKYHTVKGDTVEIPYSQLQWVEYKK